MAKNASFFTKTIFSVKYFKFRNKSLALRKEQILNFNFN